MKTKSKTKIKPKSKTKIKKHKEYKIHSFEDLMKVVNEKNCDMLFGNFYGVVKQFIQMKKTNKDFKFLGFTWIDDGKIEIKSTQFIIDVEH